MNTNYVISSVGDLAIYLKKLQVELDVVFVTGINNGGNTRVKDATKKRQALVEESRKFVFGTDFLEGKKDITPFVKYQPIYLALVPRECIKEEFLKQSKDESDYPRRDPGE